MNKPAFILTAVLVAVISAVIGYQYSHYIYKPDAESPPINQTTILDNDLIGKTRPLFSLPDINDHLRSIEEWDGKVIVINFWATWCPPCRKEIPEFIELQNIYQQDGLQFIGIALQKAEDVMEFIEELGINYPILVGEEEVIRVAKSYGNHVGALPYTVVIDRHAKITFVKRGPLSRNATESAIRPLL